jgi:hypothetical protein
LTSVSTILKKPPITSWILYFRSIITATDDNFA